MSENNKQFQFIGRYGEVIENVREIKTSSPDFMLMTGTGVDKDGQKRLVLFEVSKTTLKKNGKYSISANGRLPINYNTVLLMCEYKNGLLEGKEYVYSNGKQEVTVWHRGRKVIPQELVSKINEIGQILSDPAVSSAVRVGSPRKIKSAIRKVVLGTTKKKKAKEME